MHALRILLLLGLFTGRTLAIVPMPPASTQDVIDGTATYKAVTPAGLRAAGFGSPTNGISAITASNLAYQISATNNVNAATGTFSNTYAVNIVGNGRLVTNVQTSFASQALTNGTVSFMEWDTNIVVITDLVESPPTGYGAAVGRYYWVAATSAYTNGATHGIYWETDDEIVSPAPCWVLTNSGGLLIYSEAPTVYPTDGFPDIWDTLPSYGFTRNIAGAFGLKAAELVVPSIAIGSNIFIRSESASLANKIDTAENSVCIGYKSEISGGNNNTNRDRNSKIIASSYCSIVSRGGANTIINSELCVLNAYSGLSSLINAQSSTNAAQVESDIIDSSFCYLRWGSAANPTRNATIANSIHVDAAMAYSRVENSERIRVTNTYYSTITGISNTVINCWNVRVAGNGLTVSGMTNCSVFGSGSAYVVMTNGSVLATNLVTKGSSTNIVSNDWWLGSATKGIAFPASLSGQTAVFGGLTVDTTIGAGGKVTATDFEDSNMSTGVYPAYWEGKVVKVGGGWTGDSDDEYLDYGSWQLRAASFRGSASGLVIEAGTPASNATVSGAGYFKADANYLYISTGVNTWKRVAITGGY